MIYNLNFQVSITKTSISYKSRISSEIKRLYVQQYQYWMYIFSLVSRYIEYALVGFEMFTERIYDYYRHTKHI